MQNLYDEVVSLDSRCYEEFFLSEDILMEHAAIGMSEFIISKLVDITNKEKIMLTSLFKYRLKNSIEII